MARQISGYLYKIIKMKKWLYLPKQSFSILVVRSNVSESFFIVSESSTVCYQKLHIIHELNFALLSKFATERAEKSGVGDPDPAPVPDPSFFS